jgi:hypothetical protein
MIIARILGAVAAFIAVAIGTASPGWAGGPTTPTAPSASDAAHPASELSGTYTFTGGVRKHNQMDDHTVWPGLRRCRGDKLVGWKTRNTAGKRSWRLIAGT